MLLFQMVKLEFSVIAQSIPLQFVSYYIDNLVIDDYKQRQEHKRQCWAIYSRTYKRVGLLILLQNKSPWLPHSASRVSNGASH